MGLDDARRGSRRLKIAADDLFTQRVLGQLDGEIAGTSERYVLALVVWGSKV